MKKRNVVGINVGVTSETVVVARCAINDILGADVDTAVKLSALATLCKIFPKNTAISNNQFVLGPEQ